MRSTVPADEELYDDPSPRVVPTGPLNGPAEVSGDRRRPEPWIPRDYPLPAAPHRVDASLPAAPPAPRFTPTHKLMLAVFGLVCVSIVIGMAAWRIVNDARRALEAPSSASAVVSSSAPAQPASPPQPGASPEATGTGPITMEVRVLQPNYAIAPGDTLASIARRHGTTVDALASINNLENRNSISVGQRLIIP